MMSKMGKEASEIRYVSQINVNHTRYMHVDVSRCNSHVSHISGERDGREVNESCYVSQIYVKPLEYNVSKINYT